MPNNNRYEISEALQMPLPLTKEEAMQETLTQEESAARRFPILPSNANVTVIPIIPGITLFGYIRFLNASPVETRVDILRQWAGGWLRICAISILRNI